MTFFGMYIILVTALCFLLNTSIKVEFEPSDPREPINFSAAKKWAITLVACFATFLTGIPPTFSSPQSNPRG